MAARVKQVSEKKSSEASAPPFAVLVFCLLVLAAVSLLYPKELSTSLPRGSYSTQFLSHGPVITDVGYFANYSAQQTTQRVVVNYTGSGVLEARFGGFQDVSGPSGSVCSRENGLVSCVYDAPGGAAVFNILGGGNPNARYSFSCERPFEFRAMVFLGDAYTCDSPCVDSYDPEVSIIHEPAPSNSVLAHNLYSLDKLSDTTVSFSLFLTDSVKIHENANNQKMRELIFIPLVMGVFLLFIEYVILNRLFMRVYHWAKGNVLRFFGLER